MAHTIRQLQGEEMLETLYTLNSYSLHASPPYQDRDEWFRVVRERTGMICFAVFEGDTPVSVAVSTPMIQNMRMNLYPASGVWGVSTFPSARRRGYCRQTMASILATEREAGKVFSNLYPFRESFYERQGYVAFPLTKIARLTTHSISALLDLDVGSQIRLLSSEEAYDTYREYITRMRLHRHGMAFFDSGRRLDAIRHPSWAVLAEFDGELEGLMLYRILGEEVTKYTFSVMRFYYRTSRARYLMLNWIARHVDQAEKVELWLTPDEYPDTWLADTQIKIEASIRPGMSRVLDVSRIGGMETGEGSFSARISDALCPWNEGTWTLGTSAGRLEVIPSTESDCDLTIQGLTALIAGCHDPQDIPLRGWGNPSPAVQSVMKQMFPRMIPYMHEYF